MNAVLDLAGIRAGFADPGTESQAAFRFALDATARPGTIARFPPLPQLPRGVGAAAGAILLALLDADTRLWFSPLVGAVPAAYFRFHTGCRLVGEPDQADFAYVASPRELPPLAEFNGGSDAYPDRSATVVLEVPWLESGRGWKLAGPGIERETRLAVGGLGRGFTDEWREQRRRFPCGVDLLVTWGERLAALPRTVRIEED